ncbi:hypothetical protein GLOIN_2v1845720 [Rhizophagus irregularis DAOM 181602=DAOM 197198]|nr:hypothetical protein GLOIN_2v1845720 [Rhizophagus irregularis DAOM 181602=DAOM 197198]
MKSFLFTNSLSSIGKDLCFLVGNEITQSNIKQYSNSIFKVRLKNKELYLQIKIYGRPILRFHLLLTLFCACINKHS